MNLHHAIRLRLLAQRVSAVGVISPSNSGMAVHALRQLGVCNMRDGELLKRIDEVYVETDLRSRANIFHCMACCIREQHSVHEGLSEALPSLLLKMQENIFTDVDELSPTECILVMEGVVKVTPYRCVKRQLSAVLRNRSTALADVVSNPVELIGIARITVEAMQDAQPCSSAVDDDYTVHMGHSQELKQIAETIESRLDSFGKQDLLTLVDAVTLRVKPNARNTSENEVNRLRKSREQNMRDVPDECRSLLLRVLSKTRQLLTNLSPSQVSAWLLRVVHLQLHHHPLFIDLLKRLDDEHVRRDMSPSQLSTCIGFLAETFYFCRQEKSLTRTDLQFMLCIVIKLLETLVSSIENGGGSTHDCSMYLVPALLSLSDGVVRGRLEISDSLMRRSFAIMYRRFDTLTSRERADIITTVFLWGVVNKKKSTDRLQSQEQKKNPFFSQSDGDDDNDDVCSPTLWCKLVLADVDSYNTLDILQMMNEVTASVYAETVCAHTYSPSVVQPMLLRFHERLQRMVDRLHGVPVSYLARYLTSISKLGIHRKADYYNVLRIVQRWDMTDFEALRVLGVVARHHLRAVVFIKETVRRIPKYSSSLHPKQKCLLLKYLGQVRAQGFVQAPLHPSLDFGVFLTEEEISTDLPILSAAFAFIGLVKLRQFENKTIDRLLRGPLCRYEYFVEILSPLTLNELLTSFCRVDPCLVSTFTIQIVMDLAVGRLTKSRSLFVDMAETSFWMRLIRERPSLGPDAMNEEEKEDYMKTVENYFSVMAAITKTRLLDISSSHTLRPNTFLFDQMAIGYQLGVSLPEKNELHLSRHLDTKHLPQLLNDPRQVVNAVITACHIWRINPRAAKEVFDFALKNFGSLGAQEVMMIGVEMSLALHEAGNSKEQAAELMHKLHTLAKQHMSEIRRRKKLGPPEVALAVRHGLMEGPVPHHSHAAT